MVIRHGRQEYETEEAIQNTAMSPWWHHVIRFWLGRLVHDGMGNKYYIYKGKIYLP